jgi:hypothetical protein
MHYAYFSKGFLLFITYAPVPDAHDIFTRFAAVFDQTYTRFLDLQKAEAQAKEAQIEAALERVRSRSMAMHRSDELKEVIRLVLQQFVQLNIKAEHAGFYIDYKAHDDMHIWLADPNLEPFYAVIPYFDTPTWNSFLEAKAKGTTLHTDLLDFKTKNKFYRSLFKLFNIPEEAKKFYLKCKGLAMKRITSWYALEMYFSKPIPASSTCKRQKPKPVKPRSRRPWKRSGAGRLPCTIRAN